MTLGFGEEWPPGVCPGEIHGGPSDLIRRPGAAQAGAGPDGPRVHPEWAEHWTDIIVKPWFYVFDFQKQF